MNETKRVIKRRRRRGPRLEVMKEEFNKLDELMLKSVRRGFRGSGRGGWSQWNTTDTGPFTRGATFYTRLHRELHYASREKHPSTHLFIYFIYLLIFFFSFL